MIDLKETIKQEDIDKNIKLVTDKDPETQVSGLIFTSTDYDVFNFLTGNRSIDPNNVKKLKESISENGYKKSQPIIVNQDFEIIDGQHRFDACKELNLPIYFTIEQGNGDSIKLVQDLNKNQKNWHSIDYIKSYAQRGYSQYIDLLDYQQENDLTISTLMLLLSASANMAYGTINKKIKQGKIKFSEFEKNRAAILLNRIKEIQNCVPDNLSTEKKLRRFILSADFTAVITKIMRQDNYDHDRMIKQIEKSYRSIDTRSRFTLGDSLIDIYNNRLAKKKQLPKYADME